MRIIFDTNIVVDDFRLNKPEFRTLLSELLRCEHSLHISKVVVDESVNKFRERLENCRRIVKKQQYLFRGLTGVDWPELLPPEQVTDSTENYRAELQRKFDEVRAKSWGYPSVSHEDLVRMALERQRPFTDDGAGYRDALIWETVCQVAQNSTEPVAFITADGDFTNRQGDLHPDLIKRLEEKGIPKERVKVYKNVRTFVDEQITPRLEILEAIREQLNIGDYPDFDLIEALQIELNNVELPSYPSRSHLSSVEPIELGLSWMAESARLAWVEDVHEFNIETVVKTSSGEYLIDVQLDADCVFYVYIPKSFTSGIGESELPHITDADFNSYYIEGEEMSRVEIQLLTSFNPNERKLVSITMVSIYAKQSE